jgi:hypothetical protein
LSHENNSFKEVPYVIFDQAEASLICNLTGGTLEHDSLIVGGNEWARNYFVRLPDGTEIKNTGKWLEEHIWR